VLVTAVALVVASPTTRTSTPRFGVYAGPGASGLAAAERFERTTGAPLAQVLDFAAADDWTGMTRPQWLLRPHSGSDLRLEYSLPMFPDAGDGSLASCAEGRYDRHWAELARNLVAARLADAIVRPGWEFNGGWYRWAAKGRAAEYVGCFRHVVTSMRAAAGSQFRFDWNPTVGAGEFPAEQAYPGDAYVDFVGVDSYDTSTWSTLLNGDRGLAFWSRFAARHHKSMAIPEWGVLGGGGGRGDDPRYIDQIFAFMTNPGNHVAYEQYFDVDSSVGRHSIDPGTRVPKSRAKFLAWMRKLS
jgi:hypothetical protein